MEALSRETVGWRCKEAPKTDARRRLRFWKKGEDWERTARKVGGSHKVGLRSRGRGHRGADWDAQARRGKGKGYKLKGRLGRTAEAEWKNLMYREKSRRENPGGKEQ